MKTTERMLLVTLPLTEPQRESILRAAAVHGFAVRFCGSEAEALPLIGEAEVLYGTGMSLVGRAPQLKWFCSSTAGIEPYLAPGVFANADALLSNSSGAYGVTIAEHIIMVTLEMMRNESLYRTCVAAHAWPAVKPPIRSIFGSRVTFLGAGDIGQETAKRIRAFRPARMLALNRSGRNPGVFDDVWPVSRLEEALPETDLLIVSLPATADTRNLLPERRLRLLPKTAYLVNVGRGSVLDEEALERMLRAEELAGAALDVFCTEPLPKDSSLWDCPRLHINPHTAGNMTLPYTREKSVSLFLEDFENYCAGARLLRLVDRKAGY